MTPSSCPSAWPRWSSTTLAPGKFDGDKWHGFKCIGTTPCLLINYPDKLYDYKNPDEARMPHNSPEIPYNWDVVMK